MSKCTIQSPGLNVELDLKPRTDLLTCLVPALLAAMPAFIEAYMTCITAGSGSGNFKPGDRPRC